MSLVKGTVVTLSEEGVRLLVRRNADHIKRLGVVAHTPRVEGRCVSVQWEGRKTTEHLHYTFIKEYLQEP